MYIILKLTQLYGIRKKNNNFMYIQYNSNLNTKPYIFLLSQFTVLCKEILQFGIGIQLGT